MTERMTTWRWGVMLLIVLAGASGDVFGQRTSRPVAGAASHAEVVTERVAALLDELEQTGNFQAAQRGSVELFDQVLAYASIDDATAFREAAYACRLVRQLAAADSIDQQRMLRYLRANPQLGQAIAFAVRPENQVDEVYAVLEQLREQRGDKLSEYANLAAAISVVHDRELVTRVNENVAYPPAPLELFDYYVANERQMLFGIREMPVELLVYVVDIGATIDEMRWALNEYARHRQVGRLFFSIQYDESHFRRGTPKRVTEEGFTLPNIRAFGGVCADQAHFAVTVGKAIGVPSVYTVGRDSQVSHAWVGFLQQRGRGGAWNFDHGRYEAYQGVRGVTLDPQARQWVDDSYVSLLAELIGARQEQRHTAAAMTDAAVRLHTIAEANGSDWSPTALDTAGSNSGGATSRQATSPRSTDMTERLALLEAGLRASQGHLPGWLVLAHLAESGQMTFDQKRRWVDVVMRLCGQAYPDFAFVVLRPMVKTMEDLQQQDGVWERMFRTFRRRDDLAAEIRMEQGQMWEAAGEFTKAGRRYEDVINRYANAGPFVLEAVVRTEAMLERSGRGDRVLRLYRQTWSRVERPGDQYLEFQQQSNWYQLGMLYVAKLREHGQEREAQQTLSLIARQVGG